MTVAAAAGDFLSRAVGGFRRRRQQRRPVSWSRFIRRPCTKFNATLTHPSPFWPPRPGRIFQCDLRESNDRSPTRAVNIFSNEEIILNIPLRTSFRGRRGSMGRSYPVELWPRSRDMTIPKVPMIDWVVVVDPRPRWAGTGEIQIL